MPAVQAVLAELRIRKAILVGHSMGGYVALAFAELYPDFVKGLVLNSTQKKITTSESKQRSRHRVKQSYKGFVVAWQ
jgi:pimeloyl-ACP methyl ester carboxylesterase